MSGQIFISYRREESQWSARSLHDRLCRDFDATQIFMDIDAIALGEDFVKAIETTVARCDVLIAVIGNNWLTTKDEHGHRRLDNEEDFVRMEIATALKREIRVIPVLVDGVLMPRKDDLPEDLKPLVRRNALRITGTSFDGDCQRLAGAIRQVLEKPAKSAPTPESEPPIKHVVEWAAKGWEALMHEGEGDYDKAISDYSEAIRFNPNSGTYYVPRGKAYYRMKSYGEAISDFTEAIRLNPSHAEAYYNRGAAYQQLGKEAQAQADYDKAKQLGYTGPQ
jgi:tetratricopeptide (TPR) repeat protein